METQQTNLVINLINLLKKPNSSYILSVIFFTFSLLSVTLYSIISSDFCASFVSTMKFSIGRNYMFILCNGILVILVKSSSTSTSSSSVDSNNCDDHISIKRAVKQVSELSEDKTEQKCAADEMSGSTSTVFLTVQENAATVELAVEEFVSQDDHDIGDYDHDYRDGDEEEEEDAEELNRRCEDFIRRMKLGIISESRKDWF